MRCRRGSRVFRCGVSRAYRLPCRLFAGPSATSQLTGAPVSEFGASGCLSPVFRGRPKRVLVQHAASRPVRRRTTRHMPANAVAKCTHANRCLSCNSAGGRERDQMERGRAPSAMPRGLLLCAVLALIATSGMSQKTGAVTDAKVRPAPHMVTLGSCWAQPRDTFC
jgi:hypothetical protein